MAKVSKFMFHVGRTLFALPFVIFCVLKIMNWQSSLDSLDHVISLWKGEVGTTFLEKMFTFLGQIETPLLILAVGIELIGGLLLLIGVKTRLGASLIALFLVATTVLMHPFWFADQTTMFSMLSDFLKNIGLLGGALLLTGKKRCGGGCQCQGQCHCHIKDDRV